MGCGCGDGDEGHAERPAKRPDGVARVAMARIPHKVLVMSGKGGVGKTTFAVNLAFAFAAKGLRVGIVDADLHGPDVPLMTGIEGVRGQAEGEVIAPIEVIPGVRVLSISSFLPSRDSPVIWRGPAKAGVIAQFLGQADWTGTDVLVVDCPPGTGDEPLSVAQMIPDADGVVIVTSPQGVSLLDSRKCVGFAHQLNLPVLGIVENFSGFECPGCGRRIDLFKRGGGERAAGELGVPFLGRIPITEAMVEAGDTGRPLVASSPADPAAQALSAIATLLAGQWKAGKTRSKPGMAGPGPTDRHNVRLGITTEDDGGLDGMVAGHFGHAPFVTVVAIEKGQVVSARAEVNPNAAEHKPGDMPRFLQSLGVDVVVTGSMGQRAKEMFDGFGITVVTGAAGRVHDAVEAWQHGTLADWTPCAHHESGHAHGEGGCGGHGAGHGCGDAHE